MQIATITTRYDSTEDRILLAVADEDDSQASLWLTRRMTQRLVAALIDGVHECRNLRQLEAFVEKLD